MAGEGIQGYLIAPEDMDPYIDLVDRQRFNNFGVGTAAAIEEPLATGGAAHQVGLLLGDCATDEKTRCLVLSFADPESDRVIDIAALGWPSASARVEVIWQGQPVSWSYDSTSSEVAELLELPVSEVCGGSIEESLDTGSVRWITGRWRVRTTESLTNATPSSDAFGVRVQAVPFFQSSSGRIVTVRPAMPLPFETPLRAGAQVVFVPFSRFNGVTACEPRYWVSPGSRPYYQGS